MNANCLFLTVFLCVPACVPAGPAVKGAPEGKPAASIDLTTAHGLSQVKAQWRYCDAKIIQADFHNIKTYNYTPHAGVPDFDDSQWEVLTPENLKNGHGGNMWFNWYRIKITIPERVGNLDPSGTTAVLETVIDDYAEVWVDGEMPRYLGQTGGSVIAGFNVPNRVVIGRNVRPGQQIQLAVFGINGPLSAAPDNTVFMRSAALQFYTDARGPVALWPASMGADVERIEKPFDTIVGANPEFVKLAEGFTFADGPVWSTDGYLLFSDYFAQKIYKYEVKSASLSVFRENSPSKGMALDAEGRLTLCETGNRRVIRLEKDGTVTVLADKYEGKRLTSPGDLVYRADGTLYFTDRPYGRPELLHAPAKELPYNGVFSLQKGNLRLLDKTLAGPQGIALSPDEKFLYVTNHSGTEKILVRYDVGADGSVSNRKVFFDMSQDPGKDALSSMKVDGQGNLYVTGPRGIWVLSPEGKHLGTILTAKHPRNLAWADPDPKSGGHKVYMCTPYALYRMELNVPGESRPH